MDHETSVTIDAPPETVWELTVDVEAWPTFNSAMTEVRRLDSGPLRLGSEADVKQPGLRTARWRVTVLEPPRLFVWESTTAGVTSVGEHLVTPAGAGSRLVLRLRQSGRLARYVNAVYGRRVRRYLHIEAAGFREAAEAAIR